MLTATVRGHGFGGFGDAGDVSNLQKTLMSFSQAAGVAMWPVAVTGTVDDQTIAATLAAAFAIAGKPPQSLPSPAGDMIGVIHDIASKIPSRLKTAITNPASIGVLRGDGYSAPYVVDAQNFIASNAAKLVMVLNAYILLSGTPAPAPVPPQMPVPVPPQMPVMMTVSAMIPQAPGFGPVSPGQSKYPPGSLARLNTSRSVWSVYAPASGLHGGGLGVADESGACMYGVCGAGLGAGVAPAVPAGYTKVAEEPAAPGSTVSPPGTLPAGTEKDTHWYSTWWGISAMVVGAAALGTGGYYLLRTPKHAAAY
jgi:hypothetical protein